MEASRSDADVPQAETALAIKNVLAEFDQARVERERGPKARRCAIVGFREHIFSSSLGSCGDLAASHEHVFGTLVQRVLSAAPRRFRRFRGAPGQRRPRGAAATHRTQVGAALGAAALRAPGLCWQPVWLARCLASATLVFRTTQVDKLRMMQQGGVSKAVRGLHLSEDVFSGYCTLLNGGRIVHRERRSERNRNARGIPNYQNARSTLDARRYSQVGKGRDLDFGSIMSFYSKLAQGNAQQMLTRQVYRIGRFMPFFQMVAVAIAHYGFFVTQVLVTSAVDGASFALACLALVDDGGGSAAALRVVLAVYCSKLAIIFMAAPAALLFTELGLEDGPIRALKRIALQYLCLSPIFEAFKSKLMGATLVKELTVGGASSAAAPNAPVSDDPSPRNIHVVAAVSPRPVSAEYPRLPPSQVRGDGPRPRDLANGAPQALRGVPHGAEYPRLGHGVAAMHLH